MSPHVKRVPWPYEQIKDAYRELITSGQLPAGTRMPSVKEVAAQWGVTTTTAARAMRELKAEGLLTASSQGTWVADQEKREKER